MKLERVREIGLEERKKERKKEMTNNAKEIERERMLERGR